MIHGPHYGLLVQFQTDTPTFPEILETTIEGYQSRIRELPGFQSAMYYHTDNNAYCGVFAFDSEASADAALTGIKENMPHATVTKADVLSSQQIDNA